MRILLTVHQFLPEYAAGTEILTYGAAKALIARGHEVSVFTGFPARSTLPDAQRFDRYTYDGIAVERFHHNHAPMGGETNVAELEYHNPFVAAYFRDYLARTRPDVANLFHLQRLSASVVDACHDLGVPMVLTPTDFWLVCPTNQLLLPDHRLCAGPDPNSINCLRHIVSLTQPRTARVCLDLVPDAFLAAVVRALDRGFVPRQKHICQVRALAARHRHLKTRMNRLDRVAVPTRLMAQVLTQHGLHAGKVRHLPFGIDTTALAPEPRASAPERLRVGFIGTLYTHKGAHVLLEAVRSLPADVALEVRIYGDPEQFPDYFARLRRIAADDARIAFCGTFPNARIGSIFAALDVLVVPSIWHENTPLVIHCAQACRCPVIASNLGGMAEAVAHEHNGLLFEPGNAAELAQAIRRLTRDPALLLRLGQQARRPKSIARYAAELESLYEEILAERRG